MEQMAGLAAAAGILHPAAQVRLVLLGKAIMALVDFLTLFHMLLAAAAAARGQPAAQRRLVREAREAQALNGLPDPAHIMAAAAGAAATIAGLLNSGVGIEKSVLTPPTYQQT